MPPRPSNLSILTFERVRPIQSPIFRGLQIHHPPPAPLPGGRPTAQPPAPPPEGLLKARAKIIHERAWCAVPGDLKKGLAGGDSAPQRQALQGEPPDEEVFPSRPWAKAEALERLGFHHQHLAGGAAERGGPPPPFPLARPPPSRIGLPWSGLKKR